MVGSRSYKKNYIYTFNYYGAIFLTKIVNFLYGSSLTDVASMPKLLERKFIKNVNLKCNGFDLDFELITKSLRLNAKINQIDVNYHPRSFEEGKKVRALKDGFFCLSRIFIDRFISLENIKKL